MTLLSTARRPKSQEKLKKVIYKKEKPPKGTKSGKPRKRTMKRSKSENSTLPLTLSMQALPLR
jgi:hypothetical protein